MDWLKDYFVANFILIFLSLVMLIIAIQRFRQHRKISLCTIIVVGIAVILSIASRVQETLRLHGSLYGTLTMGIVGYSLRPCCIFLLILMSEKFIQMLNQKIYNLKIKCRNSMTLSEEKRKR